MLVDALSLGSYILVNAKLANLIGLHESIYVAEILDIDRRAENKKCLDSDGYFVLDRTYMTARTTFNEDTQKSVEDSLVAHGVLETKSGNKIKVNVNAITTLLMSDGEELQTTLKTTAMQSRKTKKQSICDGLKKYIRSTNVELRTAYNAWIDTVAYKGINQQTVTYTQDRIDSFTSKNLDMALEILNIATANEYKNIEYAIKVYTEQRMNNNRGTKLLGNTAPQASVAYSGATQKEFSGFSSEVF